ncbi:hypothetical protein FB567DRAFT_550724 [Paraphoma chrysanthemicola]|uniref:Uncharacterized protein n=1 Tax=Paraphoma chrysanthemicola TaxID=798071 RepID=A0A8K0R222_9PLEO|nr:hypothetical protein FB567DRAFT_550724 [Paraphoma chrysanthemicola]
MPRQTLTHALTPTPKFHQQPTWMRWTVSSTRGFSAAAELYQQDEYEQCIVALRELLADPAIPRYHHIKCLTLLGGTLGDWQEAYACFVKAETIWRITKRWYCDDKDPEVREGLDDLREGLNELKQALSDDEEGLHESMQDVDAEADVLQALAAHGAGVVEDRAIAQGEGETSSDDEMSEAGEDRILNVDEGESEAKEKDTNAGSRLLKGEESLLPFRPPQKSEPTGVMRAQ